MPGKEEWVLVQLGSQHKCVELPFRPVFPDYLSVSCGYDYTKSFGLKFQFFNVLYNFIFVVSFLKIQPAVHLNTSKALASL